MGSVLNDRFRSPWRRLARRLPGWSLSTILTQVGWVPSLILFLWSLAGFRVTGGVQALSVVWGVVLAGALLPTGIMAMTRVEDVRVSWGARFGPLLFVSGGLALLILARYDLLTYGVYGLYALVGMLPTVRQPGIALRLALCLAVCVAVPLGASLQAALLIALEKLVPLFQMRGHLEALRSKPTSREMLAVSCAPGGG